MSATNVSHQASSGSERRTGMPAIPLNLRGFLSEYQRQTLKQLEGFGWSLAFVRRPLFQSPVAVVLNPDMGTYSVLDEDGSLIEQPDLIIRH